MDKSHYLGLTKTITLGRICLEEVNLTESLAEIKLAWEQKAFLQLASASSIDIVALESNPYKPYFLQQMS